MQQRNSIKRCSNSARSQRTRNQHKRDFFKDAFTAFVMTVMVLAIGVYTMKVWATHPAERFVDGQAYLASIQGGEC